MCAPLLRLGFSLAVLSLFAVAAVPSQAQQQVVIGTTQGQNVFPFGYQPQPPAAYAVGGQYQELYSGQDFQNAVSGPVFIDSIAFASSNDTNASLLFMMPQLVFPPPRLP